MDELETHEYAWTRTGALLHIRREGSRWTLCWRRVTQRAGVEATVWATTCKHCQHEVTSAVYRVRNAEITALTSTEVA